MFRICVNCSKIEQVRNIWKKELFPYITKTLTGEDSSCSNEGDDDSDKIYRYKEWTGGEERPELITKTRSEPE